MEDPFATPHMCIAVHMTPFVRQHFYGIPEGWGHRKVHASAWKLNSETRRPSCWGPSSIRQLQDVNVGKFCAFPLCTLLGNVCVHIYIYTAIYIYMCVCAYCFSCDNWVYDFPQHAIHRILGFRRAELNIDIFDPPQMTFSTGSGSDLLSSPLCSASTVVAPRLRNMPGTTTPHTWQTRNGAKYGKLCSKEGKIDTFRAYFVYMFACNFKMVESMVKLALKKRRSAHFEHLLLISLLPCMWGGLGFQKDSPMSVLLSYTLACAGQERPLGRLEALAKKQQPDEQRPKQCWPGFQHTMAIKTYPKRNILSETIRLGIAKANAKVNHRVDHLSHAHLGTM